MKQLTLLLLTISTLSFGQSNTLTLDSCLQMAKRNYPLIKQNNLITENEKNAVSNDNKSWLPKLAFIGNATYQSEVISFAGTTFPHDSYLTAVQLEQNVFDGGQIHQQKKLDKLGGEGALQQNEVELYKLIDRIAQLYSTILLNRENLKILTIYKNDLNNKKSIVAESFKNGSALQSDVDVLDAEELKTDQNIEEAKETIQANYKTLTLFINKPVDDNTEFFTSTGMNTAPGDDITRPELKVFATQRAIWDARHKLNNSYALPKLTIGGQYAYGRPGPNFLNQDLRFFGQANVNLKWNIASLYSLNNEKQTVSINKKMIDVQQEVFEFNTKSNMLSQTAQINALKSIIEKDRLIIEKRHNISLTVSKQLENGSITSTDYLKELNAEMQATLNQKLHEVKLMYAILSFNTSKGINNF